MIHHSLIAVVVAILMHCLGSFLPAADLPPERPLWDKPPERYADVPVVEERLRALKAHPKAPSLSNRVYNSVSLPTYSIHRPKKPNGVGLVICPGGGFRDIWIDSEGHDLAIWLKQHNVTSLVLKYRTRPAQLKGANAWQDYQRAVRTDGLQAVRILRKNAEELGLKTDRIGICGFSAGGHLAISTALAPEPSPAKTDLSGQPDFAGLFYPGIPDEAAKWIESRQNICPMFIVNARVDKLTPAEKCLAFYSKLLKSGVDAELHIFSRGGHGFHLGVGRGKSTEMWPDSFAAWLRDVGMINE
ncbi:MAG: alpha/beta hydrolase [Kiritimatiellia bacterium]|jgi:acetyl esterase/lipase|nr:alpha/beta hydrolase [Kiritimatiellia bacterium]